MKVVVIGGVAAGMSAASKIKRLDPTCEVVVYEKGGYLSYGACGLPYFVGGFNDDYKKMLIRTQDEFHKSGIQTFMHHEVLKVKVEDKKILVRNIDTGDVFLDSYDKLMVATGASALKPPISGIDKEGVYQLKTMEDALLLQGVVSQSHIKKVIVIGGGYIGIEAVDAVLNLKKDVTCIEFAPRILMPFDEEISQEAVKTLVNEGVNLRLNEKVVGIKDGVNNSLVVETNVGSYEADLVVLSIGVKPNTEFLQGTNIKLAPNGAVVIDRQMRTSVDDIYSAGDCSQVYHKELEENTYLPLGTVANKCGRIAGENIVGGFKSFVGALGSAGIKVHNLELGRTGLSENQAKDRKINYKTIVVDSYDHPPYYPNPTNIKIKLIYEVGTKKIIGAQIVGEKGAVLRIDIFALAIHKEMTTDELGMVDFVYAPPFAGVWDAVHIACNAAK